MSGGKKDGSWSGWSKRWVDDGRDGETRDHIVRLRLLQLTHHVVPSLDFKSGPELSGRRLGVWEVKGNRREVKKLEGRSV